MSKGHIDCDDARIKLVKDTDATLSSLTALPAVLSPVFNSGVYSYTATVSADTQAVTLSATATDEDASVVSETVGVKNLETGVNTFVVKCVADDGITYKEYTVVITRETPPAYLSDNSLSALSIEGLSLSPSFSGETLAYTTSTESATVPLITAIPTVDGATVDIQKPETFRLGRNEILITVTALDGTQKCYLVAITYNPPNLYGDNTLKELHMNGKITLSPAFSSEITTYKGATKFTTIPEVVATPNDSYARVAITKPSKFIKGENTITITVTALNGTTKDYYIIITCNPSDGGGGGGGGGAGFGGVQTEPVTPTRPSGKFNDLNGYDWALDAIDKLVQKSIVSGTSATTFEPAKSVNRAEFAKLVVSAFGLTLKNDKVLSFSDVNSAEWYKQYVDIAVSNGIVTGYENNTFRPDNTITREEMCVMLARALKNYELPDKESKTFADENKVSGWATDAVSLLSSHSIINGKGNDMFAPLDNASRAESAVTISRILTLIGK